MRRTPTGKRRRSPKQKLIHEEIPSDRPRVILHVGPALEERITTAAREPIQIEALLEAYEEVLNLKYAVKRALPLTPRNDEEYQDLLWRFTTDLHALGLPRGEWNIPMGAPSSGRLDITFDTWLKQYRQWANTTHKYAPKGDAGRPPEKLGDQIMRAYQDEGSPTKLSSELLDKIVRLTIPMEETSLDPLLRRKIRRGNRELVRSTIKRRRGAPSSTSAT